MSADVFTQHGLTKREAFAMAAMQGILACPADDLGHDIGSDVEVLPEDIASYAVECADALLAELSKPDPMTREQQAAEVQVRA